MSKSARKQAAARPPVEALQYEKLALSAFDLCNRQLNQLDTLVTLATSICRNPAVTDEERQRERTLLELLVCTGEQYRQELTGDRELYQVIALDACGIAQSRLSATHAARLLAAAAAQVEVQGEAADKPAAGVGEAKPTTRQRVAGKPAADARSSVRRRTTASRH